jgi:hypothetical protein
MQSYLEHPAVEQTRRDLETLKERRRRLEAGELPFVDSPDGQPPIGFSREQEIAWTDAKIAELATQAEEREWQPAAPRSRA